MLTVIPFPQARAGSRRRPLPPAALADLIADFLTDLAVAGRRPETRRRHAGELRRYAAWLESRDLHWSRATEEDIRAYQRTRAQLSASSQAATICALRVFYRWLSDRRQIATSPAEAIAGPRRPKPTPKALTRAQIRTLRDYLRSQAGRRARRDEALIVTALYTGLRAAELASLRWSDLDLDQGTLVVELSKMNHGRALALHPDLVALLRQWRSVQAASDAAAVFGDVRSGQAISAARVGKIARGVARACGLPELHTHRLRHSFATWTLRESKDLYAVSKALGHGQLKQTEVYIPAAVDIDQLAAAIGHLPGLDDW